MISSNGTNTWVDVTVVGNQALHGKAGRLYACLCVSCDLGYRPGCSVCVRVRVCGCACVRLFDSACSLSVCPCVCACLAVGGITMRAEVNDGDAMRGGGGVFIKTSQNTFGNPECTKGQYFPFNNNFADFVRRRHGG